jgi:nitroreductase
MDLSRLIAERRSYRSLEPVNITEETIDILAEAARLAPSCFNNQPWRFVFVYQQEQLQKLFSALNSGNRWARRASLVIAVFSEPEEDCRIKGRDYYLYDTGTAVGFLLLKATDLGLVAHPIAGFDEGLAKEILHIPEHMTVITLIIVAKRSSGVNPDLSEKQRASEEKRPQRLSLNEFVFRQTFSEGKD